jgi:putative NADH-flavin reductase
MKIAVLGANGGTGVEVLKQGLERGHSMVALVRRPESIELQHPNLTVKSVNAYETASVANGLRGADAVVSSIGGGGLFSSRKAAGLLSGTAKHIIAAAQQENVRRVIALSSVGVVVDPHEGFVYRHVIKRILDPYYVDMKQMEDMYFKSGLDFTLVRPPLILDKPLTGIYRVQADGLGIVTRGYRLARADLAHFILGELEHPKFVGKPVGIAY